jgi:hypothetical protein
MVIGQDGAFGHAALVAGTRESGRLADVAPACEQRVVTSRRTRGPVPPPRGPVECVAAVSFYPTRTLTFLLVPREYG